MNVRALCCLFAEKYGWTPQQTCSLTFPQVFMFIDSDRAGGGRGYTDMSMEQARRMGYIK